MGDELLNVLLGNGTSVSRARLSRYTNYFRKTLLQSVATEARLHPLGFIYVIKDIGTTAKLRFHLWLSNFRISAEQKPAELHDHLFDLSSLLIVGRLENDTYSFQPDSAGKYERVTIEYSRSTSFGHVSENFGVLHHVSNRTYRSGEIYRMSAGIIHKGTATQFPTGTIVLADYANQKPPPHIVVKRGSNVPSKFNRRFLRPKEIRQVTRLIEAL